MSRPALFLDRDGVINVDHGYVGTRDRFDFIVGIFDLCRRAAQRGLAIIVVTNQAGIARGYYSEEDFFSLSEWMRSEFVQRGVVLTAVYHCPFHPDATIERYRRVSQWRKPSPGMIFQAQSDHDLDLAHSLLIGDNESDIEAGLSAGVGCNILFRQESSRSLTNATAVVHQLSEVPRFFPPRPVAMISQHVGGPQKRQ